MITPATNLSLLQPICPYFPTTTGECSGCQSKKEVFINKVNFFKQLLYGWFAKEKF